jgi:ectoine hydroxylase-related dioxygenase (phytanoyl-CoA dioxygenase family)
MDGMGRGRPDARAGTGGPGPDGRAAMDRDGYLVVRGFFDAAEVRDLLAWTDEVTAAPEVPGRHMVYHEDSLTEPGRRVVQRIENFCPFHPGFDRVVRGGRLLDWTAALLDGPAVLFKEKINFKMPGAPGFKAHQDQQAGWTRYAPIFITALVTLDPATVENGCLEMVPGRHRDGLLGEEWNPLSEDGLDLVPVPTAPGDVIFFDSFAPHASKPNLTGSPRRVLYLTYNAAGYGDHRVQYFADKRAAFPPDVERAAGASYVFKV